MTKRLPALAGLCVAIGAANYVYLQAFEAANAKPVSRSRGIAPQVQSVKSAPRESMAAKAVINKYCVTCHNEKLKNAGLMIENVDVQRVGDHAGLLE